MGIFLLVIVLMIGFLLLLFKFILSYTNFAVRLFVDSKHKDAEFILSSRMAPPEWKRRTAIRLGPTAAKWYAIRRTKSLLNYFKRTPLIESEEARKIALNDLRSVLLEWRDKTWSEIFPYQ